MADLEATLHRSWTPVTSRPRRPRGAGEDVEVVTLGTRDSSGADGRDSLFRGASITKPVTAALTMALVEDGRIDLDAPVADLLPELAEPRVLRTLESPLDDTVACERPITARHLLTGTAGHGFCTWESAVTPLLMERLHQAADDIHEVPAPDEWMRRLATIPLMHQPGDGWTYNASYDVLGVLVARAAGQDLADVMAERLLDPLGMADTRLPRARRQGRPAHHDVRRRRRRAGRARRAGRVLHARRRPSLPGPAGSSPPRTTGWPSGGCCSPGAATC